MATNTDTDRSKDTDDRTDEVPTSDVTPSSREVLLDVEDMHTYYGESHVLQGVSLDVGKGEFVTLVGRNGAGKTTTLKSIMGLVPPRRGTVTFAGVEIQGADPYEIAGQGIGYVPGSRNVFPDLTVRENLVTGTFKDGASEIPDRVYDLFPILDDRASQDAGTLSGGQQQMLVVARALVGNPKLLLIDEPFEGIQPSIVEGLSEALADINDRGTAILMVEQNARKALGLSDRAYILQNGRIVNSGTAEEIRANKDVQETYFSM